MPSGSTRDDDGLLVLLKNGDREAWDNVIRDYERLVFAIPRKMGLNEQDCEEVSQTTWLSLRSKIDMLRSSAVLAGWLTVTAQRISWKLIATNRLYIHSDEDLDPGPENTDQDLTGDLAALELRDEVRRKLESLSSKCRDLLKKLYWDPREPSYEEIAKSLGMPLGSVGPTRLRCMEKLAHMLEGGQLG